MTFDDLAKRHCQARGSGDGLDDSEVTSLIGLLPDWELAADGKAITRDFSFKNFHQTLGFVNAVGFIANREDHHPDLEAGYGHCQVTWSTHDVGGLSLNDFICAARVEFMLH